MTPSGALFGAECCRLVLCVAYCAFCGSSDQHDIVVLHCAVRRAVFCYRCVYV